MVCTYGYEWDIRIHVRSGFYHFQNMECLHVIPRLYGSNISFSGEFEWWLLNAPVSIARPLPKPVSEIQVKWMVTNIQDWCQE